MNEISKDLKTFLVGKVEEYAAIGDENTLGFVGFLLRDMYKDCPKVVLESDGDVYFVKEDEYINVENPLLRWGMENEQIRAIICPQCGESVEVLNYNETGEYDIRMDSDKEYSAERYYECPKCSVELDNHLLEELKIIEG